MPIAGHLTIGQLRQLLNSTEREPSRRARLFEPFGGRRAEVVNRLTDAVLAFIVNEGAALRKAKVLDYGCGVMPYAEAFTLAGARLTGADIGDNQYAHVRIAAEGKLPLPDQSVDYVVSFQVLEHVPVPHNYLTEGHRVLKRGGKLFLTTHGLWPYHPTPNDYHRWTRAGLVCELERAGFHVQSVNHILNEYSAAVQCFVMSGDYRGAWKGCRTLVHFITHCVIRLLESWGRHEPQIPAVLCIQGVKL